MGIQIILFFLFFFGAFVCLMFLISAIVNKEPKYKEKPLRRPFRNISSVFDFESEREKAGRLGEEEAYRYICQVKSDEDIILRNVKFVYNEQECEIDFVIVNRYGVFIIEAKNYSGYIKNDPNNRKWYKVKVSSGGNTYLKEFNSPLFQVNWHVDSLAKYLRENDIHVWIKGYSMILNKEHSQVDSDQVLHNTDELDIAIHTRAIENKYELSKSKIDKIIGIFNNK